MIAIPFPYSAESLGLKPGDRVAYRGRDVWQIESTGQMVKALWDGLEGTVKSIHDGHPPKRLESVGTAFGPFAFVVFDNAVTHEIDEEFEWETAGNTFRIEPETDSSPLVSSALDDQLG